MHWLQRLFWRLQVLFGKTGVERELEEELAYHLEREGRDYIDQGMPPDEARRRALTDFGGVERTKEQVRDVRGARGLDDLRQDLRHAMRVVRRSPAFFAAAVGILALGIGATVAMFSILEAALFRALPYPDPDRLVLGRTTFSGNINTFASFPDYLDYRDGSDDFDVMAAFIPFIQSLPVIGGANPQKAAVGVVTVDFFRALGVEPQRGRAFAPEEAQPDAPGVIVISHGFWQRWFGGAPEAVGSTLTVAGLPVEVVGIMPPGFRFRYATDLWYPIRLGTRDTGERRSHSWQVVGRMKPGVTLARAQTGIDVISAGLAETYPDTHATKGFLLTPLGRALAEGYRPTLLVLMAATALLLLIACGNVAGLLLARATSRRVELSVRTALGASRPRLVRQLFTEHLLVAIAAGGLGVGLALGLQRLILILYPLDLVGLTTVDLSGPLLAFTLLISLATALLFGTGPALTASRTDPAEDLRSSQRSSPGSRANRVRSGLVTVQVALSVVLLTGAGLLIRSLGRLQAVDVGFPTGDLVTAELTLDPGIYGDPVAREQFFRTVLEDVREMPGVVSAALIDKVPIKYPFTNWTCWNPDEPPEPGEGTPDAYARFVLPGYFETMGLPLVRGRDHERSDAGRPLPPVVINRVMAVALYGDEDPVGRRLIVNFRMSGEREYEIIGVAGDIRIRAVSSPPDFQMYFRYEDQPSNAMQLMVRTRGRMAGVAEELRQIVRARDRDALVTGVITMTGIISDSLTGNRVLSLAVSLFAAVALLLSLTGLYAVLAYHVAQRTGEIAIRIAFGASARDVMRSVVNRGLLLIGGGLGIGFAAALAVTRLIQSQLYEVGTADPVTLATIALGFPIIGIAASLVPARRATRVDPVRALQGR